MDNWKEIHSAFQVARLGTVSAAADVLSVHRATIIRHIDTLEQTLEQKLFQRHSKGYSPTELGEDLLRVARATDDQFSQFMGRARGRQSALSGQLVVTCLEVIARRIIPAIANFQNQNPDVTVRLITSDRLLQLEYGEAHIAIRAGARPSDPDNIVQEFLRTDIGMYASDEYIAQHGKPSGIAELITHRIIGPENHESRAPFNNWILENIPEESIVFRSTGAHTTPEAVMAGIGIGFVESDFAKANNLTQVMAPQEKWVSQTWLVTHVDLHRTEKVQAFLKVLKELN